MSERGSWVVTCRASGETFEIFHCENMELAKECPYWIVETAAEYSDRINNDMRRRA